MSTAIFGSLLGGLLGMLVGWAIILLLGSAPYVRKKKHDGMIVDNRAYRPSYGEPFTSWRRKFVIFPTSTLDEGYVFCRFVWRRRINKHHYLDGPVQFWFQYVVERPMRSVDSLFRR